jgi:hypothetical protein
VYEWLFELPTNTKRYLPLCKSAASKQACFDLDIELTKGSQDNYALLVSLLMAQHNKCKMMMMMRRRRMVMQGCQVLRFDHIIL